MSVVNNIAVPTLPTGELVRQGTFPEALSAVNSESSTLPLAFCPSGVSAEQTNKIQDIAREDFPKKNGNSSHCIIMYRNEDLQDLENLPSLKSRVIIPQASVANWEKLDQSVLPALKTLGETFQSANKPLDAMRVAFIPGGDRSAIPSENWHLDGGSQQRSRIVTTLRGPSTQFCTAPLDVYKENSLAVGSTTAHNKINEMLEQAPQYNLSPNLGESAIFHIKEKKNISDKIPEAGDVVHKGPDPASFEDVRILVTVDTVD